MNDFFRRTWAQVDLDAVAGNYRRIRARLSGGTKMCCVIKADAYGHGAEILAREYEALGADYFAVSNLEEAAQLRNAQIGLPILILGYTPPDMACALSDMGITQTVLSLPYAKSLAAAAREAGVTVKIHVKVDTGMSRIGFFYQDPALDAGAIDEMETACRLKGLEPEGIFTHFATADEGDGGRNYTLRQFRCFQTAIDALESRGLRFPLRHCANSAAILDYPEMQMDMVRPGIILYGLAPSGKIAHPMELEPVMELKSIVSMVKTVRQNISVSYGREFTAPVPAVVATVPAGYADGYPRSLFHCAQALVRGRRVCILGRVCMDQMMLDVTDVPAVQEGDTVTLFGRDGGMLLSVDELADCLGTINYELVCMINKRVPRIYYKNGEAVEELNYICDNI